MILLFTLLLAGGLAGAHPISNYQVQLELSAEATLVTIDFTYDDVVMIESVLPDDEGRFAPEELRAALEDFQRRVEQGTGLYDSGAAPLVLAEASLSGTTEPGVLTYDDVGEVGCTLRLRYPALDDPAKSSVLFDWGGWRKSISSLFYCEWSQPDGSGGHVIWGERHRFPMLPPADADAILFGDDQYLLARPIEETRTGFSYLYVEADHVRHEFVLPLMSLAREITPYGSNLSLAAFIGDEERAAVEALLDEHLGGDAALSIEGAAARPAESHLRWFTRDSLRRGVSAAEDGAISLATGFVGTMSVYPVEDRAQHLALDSSGWFDLLDDHVVSVVVGDKTARHVLESGDPTLEWRGEPDADPVATPKEVAFDPPPRDRRFAWMALVAFLAAVPLLARSRRLGFTLTAVAAALGAAHVLVPLHHLDDGDAPAVFESLLHNTYLACGHQDERKALELLGATSEGALLEELYLDLRGQLTGPWPTGAGTKVQDVRMIECEVTEHDAGRLGALCSWSLDARIEHWGHVHDRSLEITGRLTALADGERWRFADVVLVDKRIASAKSRPR